MQLVIRTLSVLRHLSKHTTGQSLGDIGEALDIPLPTLHRLMAVLSAEEFVARASRDKRYTLGSAAIGLAQGPRHVPDIARPYMGELTANTQETTFLTEMIGGRAVCTALVDGTRALRLFVRIGQEMPIHAAASARAILAFLPPKEVAQLLTEHRLTRFTADTPHTVDAVEAHLKEVRRSGYDICDQELDLNVLAISAPVRSLGGEVTASLTLAAPHDRFDDATKRRWSTEVLRVAASISRESGYATPDPMTSIRI